MIPPMRALWRGSPDFSGRGSRRVETPARTGRAGGRPAARSRQRRFSPRSPFVILPKQINYAALIFGDAVPEVSYLLLGNVFPSPLCPPLADTPSLIPTVLTAGATWRPLPDTIGVSVPACR